MDFVLFLTSYPTCLCWSVTALSPEHPGFPLQSLWSPLALRYLLRVIGTFNTHLLSNYGVQCLHSSGYNSSGQHLVTW